MRPPFLSAIIANYNHGAFLEERLLSILGLLTEADELKEEDREESELVVVDDCSTDNSISIIEKIAARNRRLKFYRNEKNCGAIYSFNRALSLAKGEYISMLASDDISLPGFFLKSLKALLAHPEIPLCGSDFSEFWDHAPQDIKTSRFLRTDREFLVFPPGRTVKLFRTPKFWIPGQTAIIRRETAIKYGGYNPELKFMTDWFLIHSIALKEGLVYLPEVFSMCRKHQKSYSAALLSDKVEKRKTHIHFLEILSKSDKRTRLLFRKSSIVTIFVKSLFFYVLLRPKYWDFLLYSNIKAFNKGLLFVKKFFRGEVPSS